MMSNAWNNKGDIAKFALSSLPLVLGEGPEKEELEPCAIQADYLDSLKQVLIGMRSLKLQNPYFDISEFH